MADEENIESIEFSKFLESTPPGNPYRVPDFAFRGSNAYYLDIRKPVLSLYCTSETCDDEHFFDQTGTVGTVKAEELFRVFVSYTCRHCRKYSKDFAIVGYYEPSEKTFYLHKVGEIPAYGPKTPNRVLNIVGKDRALYLKGRRAESQGLGIAAFAYYRRVVENQKGKLIDEILKVLRIQNVGETVIRLFESAKAEQQFSKSVEMVKEAVPETLRIHGHNPLTLLHSALSEGVHALSDEECLGIAQSVRIVLLDFTEKVESALKDSAEIKGAISTLLRKGKPPTSIKNDTEGIQK